MPRILFAAPPQDWESYGPLLPAELARAGVAAELTRAADRPESIDHIVCTPEGIADFAPFVNCRLVQSLWAGVEKILQRPGLTQPLARMVDPNIARVERGEPPRHLVDRARGY